ncbi:hypothetical protein LX24_02365 [Desulfallas thermosapovorans DSM 6562]|uniref:Helix-turn-helix protein n=2 Tax=Desulfallas thermosapovorans TaxID=58137 RepID=A0A5S4ZNW7_9FIRM|nr:hypothetical protein LX24_02365 [Desulfallas thermosapovorans DSM 6562]
MPIPLFFVLGHRRVAANLTVAHAAELLGIAPSYLFSAEEFQKVPNPDARIKTKFFSSKTITLSDRITEWLIANPVPSPFSVEPQEVRQRIVRDFIFKSIWNNYLFGPFLPGRSFLFTWYLVNILSDGNLDKYNDNNITIIAPCNKEIASAVWWFFMRVWGNFSTGRRKTIHEAEFISSVPDIYSVEPNKPIGQLWFKSIDVFSQYADLLIYLYTDRIEHMFSSSAAQWAKWNEFYKHNFCSGPWEPRWGCVFIPRLMQHRVNLPPFPEPEITVTLLAPHKKITFHIESTSILDDINSRDYYYEGGFYVTVCEDSRDNKESQED